MLQSFYQNHGRKILVLTAVSLPFLLHAARRTVEHKHNDIRKWLPANLASTRDYLWFRHHFGGDQYVLVSWEGCLLTDPRLEQLADKALARDAASGGRNRHFQRVLTGSRMLKEFSAVSSDENRTGYDETALRLRGTLIGPDGSHTCALFFLSDHGERFYRRAVDMLYAVADDCGIPRESIRMGGIPLENRALDLEGEWTLAWLASLSAIVGVGFAWYFLRSWCLTACVFFIAASSAVASLAIVWLRGAHIDAFQLTMPSVVYVLTLSATIHLVNYYRDALSEVGRERAVAVAVLRGWQPCTVAAATTSLGLLSLMTSNLVPVRLFGLHTAAGVIGSLFFVLAVLPALLEMLGSKVEPRAESPPSRSAKCREWLIAVTLRHHLAAGVLMLALLTLSAWGFSRMTTSLGFLTMFPRDAKIIRDYQWLEEKLGPMGTVEVVIRYDGAESKWNFADRFDMVAAVHREIADVEEVGGVLSLATFLSPPPRSTGRNWLARAVYSRRVERQQERLFDTNYLRKGDDESQELWRVSARLWALQDTDYIEMRRRIESRVEPILARAALDENQVSAAYTGVALLASEAHRELLTGLLSSLALAFALIGLVMIAVLRSAPAGFVAMLPNLFPVLLIFGIMGWLQIPLDMGSVITATVAMGVAVDDTVHLLTWYRRGLDQGWDRLRATRQAFRLCGTAMLTTTTVAGVGLLVFALSSFTPTRQFGLLMFLLLVAALVGDLFFLPALLVGPAGRFFNRNRKRRAHEKRPREAG